MSSYRLAAAYTARGSTRRGAGGVADGCTMERPCAMRASTHLPSLWKVRATTAGSHIRSNRAAQVAQVSRCARMALSLASDK